MLIASFRLCSSIHPFILIHCIHQIHLSRLVHHPFIHLITTVLVPLDEPEKMVRYTVPPPMNTAAEWAAHHAVLHQGPRLGLGPNVHTPSAERSWAGEGLRRGGDGGESPLDEKKNGSFLLGGLSAPMTQTPLPTPENCMSCKRRKQNSPPHNVY